MLPPSMRYTATRQVSPGQAIGFLFIPFFNWYWIFVANVGYCDALDRMLINQGSHRRAPKGLAIACCVTQLVPYVNILIAPFLWMTYMILADRAKAELLPR